MNTEQYRVQDKQNAYLNNVPVTLFKLYEFWDSAYLHVGNYSVPGHDATDAQCINNYEHLHTTEGEEE